MCQKLLPLSDKVSSFPWLRELNIYIIYNYIHNIPEHNNSIIYRRPYKDIHNCFVSTLGLAGFYLIQDNFFFIDDRNSVCFLIFLLTV